MRAIFVSTLTLTGLLLASGCAVMGRQQVNQVPPSTAVERIEPGMSKSEVTSRLGAPQDILFIRKDNDPVRELAYVYDRTVTKYTGIVFAFLNFGNSDQKQDRVVVFFAEDGSVNHVGSTYRGEDAAYGFPFGQ